MRTLSPRGALPTLFGYARHSTAAAVLTGFDGEGVGFLVSLTLCHGLAAQDSHVHQIVTVAVTETTAVEVWPLGAERREG